MKNHWVHDWEGRLRKELPNMDRALERDLITIRRTVLSQGMYIFRSAKLEEAAEMISEETELILLTKHLWNAAVSAGFQNASLFVLQQGKGTPFKSRVCTSYHTDWCERYSAQKYQYIDPTVTSALKRQEPYRFSEVRGQSPAETEFWADAERHGAGVNGLVVPVRLPCEAMMAITFASSATARMVDARCTEHLSDLSVIAQLSAEAFSVLARNQPVTKAALSQDELQFLRTLVTSDDPQAALAIMPTFGSPRSMQQSIQEKLGVRTILQAVALASLQKWFDDVDFSMSDVNAVCQVLKGWDTVAQIQSNAEVETTLSGSVANSNG